MEEICAKFGMKVRQLREQCDMSQEKLAEETGLHRTYISAVERGKRSISLMNINKIAKALRVSVKELFEE